MFTILIPTALAAVMSPEAPAAPGAPSPAEGAAPLEASAPSGSASEEDAVELSVPLAEDEALNEWEGSLAGGVFLSFGNTERLTANVIADAIYRREADRFTLGGWWYFGRETVTDTTTAAETKETTDDRYGARFQYDYFLNEKSYILGMVLAEHDANANIDLRTTFGVGYGRQIIEQDELAWGLEGGLNYFTESYITVPPGSPSDDNRITARVASDLMWKPTEAFSLGNLLETYVPLESDKNWYTRVTTNARYDLSEVLFTQLQWLVDYNTEPAPGAKNADHRLSFSVGWTF